MNRYFIKLSFKGTRYHGWQKQENATTVQSVLDDALSTFFSSPIETVGCGRTDAGVHASEFFAHCDLPEIEDPSQVVYKLNKILPKDIAIMDILSVKADGHSRFDAVKRVYEYKVSRQKNPFSQELAYYYYGELDVDAMNECANLLMEYEDFSAFSKSNTQVNNNNCKVYYAGWVIHEGELVFTIAANRFLRNMVRAIVGTLMEVGKGKLDSTGFRKVIEAKDRGEAGVSVPADGLYLKAIEYPGEVFIR